MGDGVDVFTGEEEIIWKWSSGGCGMGSLGIIIGSQSMI